MSQSQWFFLTIRSNWTTAVALLCATGALSVFWKSSALRISDYHHVLLSGRSLSTSKTPEETTRHFLSTELCMGTERDRNVRGPGFWITHVYSPPGKDRQFIRAPLECTVWTRRGSPHIPHKCWWGLDYSLSPRESGRLLVCFPAALRLACLSRPSPASLKTRCLGWSGRTEGLST